MSKLLAVLVALFAAAWFAVPAFASGTDGSTGYIEICKYSTGSPALTGSFQFSVNGHGSISVPVGQCSAPIEVPAGTATVAEVAHPWYAVAAQSYVTADGVTTQVAEPGFVLDEIPVAAGGISQETVVNYTDEAVMGNLEICKTAADTSGLTGTFAFSIGGAFTANIAAPSDQSVAVGSCTQPFAVPAGPVVVTEEPTNAQTYVTSISVQPENALVSSSTTDATATVTVNPGPTAETMVTFENSQSSLKLCKQWGDSSTAPTTPFSFTVSADGGASSTYSLVAANPASCVMVPLRYRAGSMVTIAEGTFPGTYVSDITWNGKSFDDPWYVEKYGALITYDPAARTVAFPIHSGVNDVMFVNDPAPAVPLKVCKLGTGTGPFSFTVSPAGYTASFTGLAGTTLAPATVSVPTPGQCTVVGWFPYDQTVSITEAAGNLTGVVVDPTSATAQIVGTPNLTTRTAMVLLGNYDLIPSDFLADWAIVDFTNGAGGGSTVVPPAGSTQPVSGTAPAPVSATIVSVAPPTKVATPAKATSLKVTSARIVTVGKGRYVVVRVNGAAKTAHVHVTLMNKQHKVVGRVTRYVATNKAVRIGNLRLGPSILSVRVSL